MRILIVDDDPLGRSFLMQLLQQQGYVHCYEAENGLEAIILAQQIKPDLVLLEPLMEGYETANELKNMAGDIYLPVIFISTLDDESVLARCLELGGDDFVSKPFSKTILAAKIRAHIRTRLLSKRTVEQNKQLSFYRNTIEREHKIVEHIFANALTVDPSLKPFIDFQLNPASDFNGDMFLIHASPTGGLYFLIGDFTGHGLASAIGALPVSKAFHTMSSKGLSLIEMSETINATLLQLLPDEMFFAAIMVEISGSGKQINVWNGGMPSLLLQDKQGQIIHRFHSRHMALGILDGSEFEPDIERYEAKYGDRLIGFSDGVIEIKNDLGHMLGDQGLEKLLIACPQANVDMILSKLVRFEGSRIRNDDVTLFIYTCQLLEQINHTQVSFTWPIEFKLGLSYQLIKLGDPIGEIVNILTNDLNIYSCHSEVYTVLSELYNNAIDHGLLKLNSALKQTEEGFFEYFNLRQQRLDVLREGNILLSVQYRPEDKSLVIEVSDSGAGYDIAATNQNSDIEKSYGRGLSLVKELCHSVQHFDDGRTVKVVFKV